MVATQPIIPKILPMPFDWCEVPEGEFEIGNLGLRRNLPTYWLAKYPITVAQYSVFVDSNGYAIDHYWTEAGWQWKTEHNIEKPLYWDDTDWHIPDCPIIGVSWFESCAFAKWISVETGLNVTLPTELQWEKALRGTDRRIYPWGNEWDETKSNTFESRIRGVTPVTQYPAGASSYGVMDMYGNVWEWCLNRHKLEPYMEEFFKNQYVEIQRGVSWASTQKHHGLYRQPIHPTKRSETAGFRICIIQ